MRTVFEAFALSLWIIAFRYLTVKSPSTNLGIA